MCYNFPLEVKRSPTVVNQITAKIRKWQHQLHAKTISPNQTWGLENRAEGFVQLFEKWLTVPSRILDIGGGWGFYADPLMRRGHKTTVLDVVKPGFQKAPVVLYGGKRIPFPDKSFDASLLITMLHHVPEPEELIREAKRVTRNTLIVVEDIYNHALGRAWTIVRDQLYNFEFFGHPRQFKKGKEWITFFERMGFTLLEEKRVYTWIAGLRILNGVFVFKI